MVAKVSARMFLLNTNGKQLHPNITQCEIYSHSTEWEITMIQQSNHSRTRLASFFGFRHSFRLVWRSSEYKMQWEMCMNLYRRHILKVWDAEPRLNRALGIDRFGGYWQLCPWFIAF